MIEVPGAGPEGTTLTIRRGDLVLLTGPNGSGKTSLLRALAGLPAPRPWPGIRIDGREPRDWSATEAASNVRFAPHPPRDGLVGLTVAGELRMRGLSASAAATDFVAGLERRDVAALSAGQARRAALAVTLAHPAPIVLLDEPGEGLDAEGLRLLRAHVLRSLEAGCVVAADHAGALGNLPADSVRIVNIVPVPSANLQAGPRASAPSESGTPPRTPAAQATSLPVSAPGAPPVEPVLEAAAMTVDVGDATLRFPPIRLGAGLHALVGPNGSGKSTWLAALAGLRGDRPVAIRDAAPRCGHNVRLLLPDAGALATNATVADELGNAKQAPWVDAELLGAHPLALSAGQAQRVALAKALQPGAALYLLDEPEAHLDAPGRATLDSALQGLAASGACILVATHDTDLAAQAVRTIRLEALV